MYLLCGNATASTSGVPDNLSNRTLLSQPRDYRFNLLFAQQMVDSITAPPLDSLKLRNPYMAIFYSFVPGIIVHGSGHFYAGHARTGARLLGAEAAGGVLIYGSIVLTMADSQTGAGLAALAGVTLFVGSWVYDVVRSPLVVQQTEQRAPRKQTRPIEISDEGRRLEIGARMAVLSTKHFQLFMFGVQNGQGEHMLMSIAGRLILLSALLMYLLSGNANASARRVPDNLPNRILLSQPRHQRFSLLFAQQTQDSTRLQISPSLKRKSPYMAAFYSVIPGVLVHGSGHFYAGKEGTGSALLGLEAAGVLLLYFGSLSAFQGSSHQNDTDAMGYIGLALFAGSWVYDMVGSPIAVVRRNRYIKETEGTQYDFKREPRQFRLTFAWHFSL